MKKCTKCGLLKNELEFTKNKNNKDGLSSQCKDCVNEYYLNNKDEILKFGKNYRKDHKKQYNILQKKYYVNNPERQLFYMYRLNDKKKGFICDLTENWIKQNITNKSCIYCGETEHIGCDRIDNNKGHTTDNVVPCCVDCNKTRSNRFTVNEMLKIGKVIKVIKKERKLNKETIKNYEL